MKKIFILVLFLFQFMFAEEIYATFDVVSEKSSQLGLSASGIVSTLNVNVGDRIKSGRQRGRCICRKQASPL